MLRFFIANPEIDPSNTKTASETKTPEAQTQTQSKSKSKSTAFAAGNETESSVTEKTALDGQITTYNKVKDVHVRQEDTIERKRAEKEEKDEREKRDKEDRDNLRQQLKAALSQIADLERDLLLSAQIGNELVESNTLLLSLSAKSNSNSTNNSDSLSSARPSLPLSTLVPSPPLSTFVSSPGHPASGNTDSNAIHAYPQPHENMAMESNSSMPSYQTSSIISTISSATSSLYNQCNNNDSIAFRDKTNRASQLIELFNNSSTSSIQIHENDNSTNATRSKNHAHPQSQNATIITSPSSLENASVSSRPSRSSSLRLRLKRTDSTASFYSHVMDLERENAGNIFFPDFSEMLISTCRIKRAITHCSYQCIRCGGTSITNSQKAK
jgi:hypothetical protein